MVTTEQLFSSAEACKIIGVTYRQLDYWARCNIVSPVHEARGSGTQRGYDEWDLRRLYLTKMLTDAGLFLGEVAKIIEKLRKGDLDDDRVLKINLTTGKLISSYAEISPYPHANQLWLVLKFHMPRLPE